MKFASTSGTFENPPAGAHPAVCTKMIDLGTQETTWQGTTKFAHKVKIVFELAEKMKDGRPFLTMRDFTVSLHENASLRAFLASWRGRDFTDEELAGFDPKVLIGKGCLLSLIEKGEYINIDSCMRLPKGMEAPAPVGDTVFFSLSEFDQAEFDKLSDKIREKIMKSPEYQSLKGITSTQGMISSTNTDDDCVF
jgi:hypothetical protein